jgi:DinB superfamily
MSAPAPYAEHIGALDPVAVLRTSLDDYQARILRFGSTDWQRPWAPGKWTIAQIVVHVTQWEMIMGIRLRCGVAAPDFTVQPLDQDELMRVEGDVVDGPTAFGAFVAVRHMNIAFAESLSPAVRRKRVMHPERGAIDVEQLLVTLAGHGVHHLKQIAAVG